MCTENMACGGDYCCCSLVTRFSLTLMQPHGLYPTRPFLSMGFPRQEYWSGLPFPSPGNLPHPGIEPVSPALTGTLITTEPPEKPLWLRRCPQITPQSPLYVLWNQSADSLLPWYFRNPWLVCVDLWVCVDLHRSSCICELMATHSLSSIYTERHWIPL